MIKLNPETVTSIKLTNVARMKPVLSEVEGRSGIRVLLVMNIPDYAAKRLHPGYSYSHCLNLMAVPEAVETIKTSSRC